MDARAPPSSLRKIRTKRRYPEMASSCLCGYVLREVMILG